MLVRATDKYEKLKIKDKELDRIPKEGEEFKISKERYKVLTEQNKYNVAFVEKVETKVKREITKKKIKQETRKIKE